MGNRDKVIKKWVADAIEIDISSMEGMVYTNDIINNFLHQDNWLFLSANKGMGKTLLMSFKRYLASSEHTSATFIPRNKPYLDNMSVVNNVNKKMEEYMTEQKATVKMWIFSFQVSILSHIKFKFPENELETLKQHLPTSYIQYITNGDIWVNPTDIFRELMQGSPNEWNKIVSHSSVLEIALKQIRSEVRVFIDRVDQALANVNQKTWIEVQGALIDAAWSIFNSNNHIKVYASIRQEAYANYSSPTMANVMVFELSYAKRELIHILNKLALFYEGKNSFEDFIAPITKVNTIGVEENFIEFLIRHTLHRPRDIVKICSGISNNPDRDDLTSVMNTVANIANNQVIPYIFSESEVFLDCLKIEPDRKALLSMLTQNILTYSEIVDIFAKVNNLDRNVIGKLELQHEKYYHPFSELYKIGLLGIVTDKNIQKFRMPNDPQNFHSFELPESRYYILHPALRNYMEVLSGSRYDVFKFIVTGHNLEWNEPLNDYLISLQNKLFKLGDTKFRNEFLGIMARNFNYIKRHYRLPSGDDLLILERLVDQVINVTNEDSKLQNAIDLMELLEKSKVSISSVSGLMDVTGYWEMLETYENGRTSGEVILRQDERHVTGTVILRDIMDGGTRYSIEQTVAGTVDGKSFVLEGKSFRLVEGERQHYELDKWSGVLRAADTIVGTSEDAQGVKGNFTMTRIH
jgi:hypothetical protein